MNFKELFEGATPKLPGAVGGIKVMSMDQFLAQSNDEPEEKIDEMSSEELDKMSPEQLVRYANDARNNKIKNVDPKSIDKAYGKSISIMFPDSDKRNKQSTNHRQQNMAEGEVIPMQPRNLLNNNLIIQLKALSETALEIFWEGSYVPTAAQGQMAQLSKQEQSKIFKRNVAQFKALGYDTSIFEDDMDILFLHSIAREAWYDSKKPMSKYRGLPDLEYNSETNSLKIIDLIGDDDEGIVYDKNVYEQDVEEGKKKKKKKSSRSKQSYFFPGYAYYGGGDSGESGGEGGGGESRNRGMAEATKLPAQTRELKGQELDDYLDRIRNREKGKTDKYKLPYIHRSSVVKFYNEEGKRYDTDQIKQTLGVRPKKLLKQNEKMKHSNGELEQFFNIGFAALVGIALDENTNELIVVNTCPGAGSCKIECFAMKGGKVQFEGPWLSDGRILTFLLNDPDGFFNQLSNEITKEEKLAQKGGYNLTIRWHDAGDFFSPEYMDLAFKLAAAHPDVKFYAYTKIADAALGQKPSNFIVNWSEGASTSQEKKVKAQDANLDKTKNSRIVPSKLFYDLLKKDSEGKLDKTADGAWQPKDADALNELKDRLAAAYNLKRDSIISYSEMMATPQKNNVQKWNVIIAPGEGDISANRQDVLSTLLLKH